MEFQGAIGVNKKMQNLKLKLASAAVASLLSSTAFAAGFALYPEASTVAIGNSGAGIAAEVPDASTAWYNPAGLVLIPSTQGVFSAVGVLPSVKLTGNSTYFTDGLPPYTQNFENLQAGKNALIPGGFVAIPLGPNSAFGFSIVAPFGLATEYDTDSPVRYSSTFTEIITVDISPSLAGRVTDNVSIGAGIDFQWSKVKFNNIFGSPAVAQIFLPTPHFLDSLSYNTGQSFAISFHAGILGMFNDNRTRLGLNYQHRVKHSFRGESKLRGRLADPNLINPVAYVRSPYLYSNNVELPSTTTLSLFHALTDRLDLLGSVVYTGWGVFNFIQLNNLVAFSSDLDSTVVVSGTTVQNYRDAWRFALGANYQVNEKLRLRAGGGWDKTPIRDEFRDTRLPDNSRGMISVGLHYDVYPHIGFDAGYTHLFMERATLNSFRQFGADSVFNVNARSRGSAELIGLQVSYMMDGPVEKDTMKP